MAAPGENLKINGDRLWDSIMEMAKIGPGVAGGNNRQTLTDADAEGRALFQTWCEAAGCTMGVDTMGTMFATPRGRATPMRCRSMSAATSTPSRRAANTTACWACLGGLEVVRTLNDLGIKTKHPIVVTNWTNEEGTRFAPAMLASGVFAGMHELDWAYDREDAEGKTFGDELERIGWVGRRGGRRAQDARDVRAAYRAGPDPGGRGQGHRRRHPRPGPVLDRRCTMTGKESHTGSTPMPMRRNAGLRHGADHRSWSHEIAMEHQPNAVGAVGHIDVYPNSRNVIPGKVVFTVDFRSPDLIEVIDAMLAEFAARAPKICEDIATEPRLRDRRPVRPGGLRRRLRRRGAQGGRAAGLFASWTSSRAPGTTPAGSTDVAPTAMIMCPCVDGLSHNEAEEISPDWAARGRTCCSTRWWRRRRS